MSLLIVLLLSVSSLEYPEDPYMLLQRADSAVSGVERVSYSFSFRGTGSLGNIIPVLLGKASLSSGEESLHPLMVLDFLEIEVPGVIDEFTVPSTYIATDDTLYRIDHPRQTVHYGVATPDASVLFNFPPASVMMEYVLENPFSDEIAADSIAVLREDSAGGVPCHVLHVYYDLPEGSEAVWYLGVEDLLPRAVERIGYYGSRGTPGGQRLEISNMEFTFPAEPEGAVPSGYTRETGFGLAAPGDSAEAIFLAGTDGFTRRVAFPGEKPVLLFFFSSWDRASLSAMGVVNGLSDTEGERMDVYGISIWENNDPLFRLAALDTGFPLLVYGSDTAGDYGIQTVPTAVLIDADGIVIHTAQGVEEITGGELEAPLRSLLEM